MEGLTVVTWRVPRAHAADLEAVTLPEPTLDKALHWLREAVGARESAYVATCQRVVHVLLDAAPDAAERLVAEHATRWERKAIEPEVFQGFAAFRHLAEAASSIDSLVVGEPQVLGQFKAAAAKCDEMGLSGPTLRHVFGLVFRAAKAVRSETDLFRGKVSLVPLTESLIAQRLGGVDRPKAAVVGTGQIGERMIELLSAYPGIELHVVSRSEERARDVAARHGAHPTTLTAFLRALPPRLDVLALVMGTDAPLVSAELLRNAASEHPLLVLDLALPRNAEAIPDPPPGLRLVQMDDLARMSEATKAERRGEIDHARSVLERELGRIRAEYETRKLAHDIAALGARFDAVAHERLALARGIGVDPEDPSFLKWYEQTVRALRHEATSALKKAGCEPRREG